MNFFEAMKALEAGEKIRLKTWNKHQFLVLSVMPRKIGKKDAPYTTIVDDRGNCSDPLGLMTCGREIKDNWEIYQEN